MVDLQPQPWQLLVMAAPESSRVVPWFPQGQYGCESLVVASAVRGMEAQAREHVVDPPQARVSHVAIRTSSRLSSEMFARPHADP